MSSFPTDLVDRKPVLLKSPLESVVCQVLFQEILGSLDNESREFQKALQKHYPLTERSTESEMNLTETGLQSTGKMRTTFRFRDRNEEWIVTMTSSSLSLESSAYAGFSDFADRWHYVSNAAIRAFEIEQQERLGLRYINRVSLSSSAGVEEMICPDLARIPEQESPLVRDLQSAFQESRFKQDDGGLTIRRGMLTEGNPESKPFYVLDFDYYTEESKAYDLDDQDRTLITFNQKISELFRWSITDKAYESFKPTGEGK